ncbi:HalOD1 output domain-containing protein [Haladaptatus sp. NG-SE-30]
MTDEPSNTDSTATESAPQPAEITYEIGETELPSEAVVQATAALTNTPPNELEPLYDVMDPDHLDGLFDDSSTHSLDEERTMEFSYNGCQVAVTTEFVVVRRNE